MKYKEPEIPEQNSKVRKFWKFIKQNLEIQIGETMNNNTTTKKSKTPKTEKGKIKKIFKVFSDLEDGKLNASGKLYDTVQDCLGIRLVQLADMDYYRILDELPEIVAKWKYTTSWSWWSLDELKEIIECWRDTHCVVRA